MKTTRTILIIDDSETDRATYRRYLKQDPHQTYSLKEADCAQAGLDLCRQQDFDVILLDFRLPDIDGLEVLSKVAKQSPNTAVIMVTGHGGEQVAVSALKGGAHDYLVKDLLSKDTLQKSLHAVITQRQLRQRLQKALQQQHLTTQLAFQIRHSLELTQILESAVDSVRQLLQCDRVLAYQFSPDMSGQIIAESVGESWRVTLGQTVEDTYFQREGAEKYRQGRKQIVKNIYQTNLDPCHVELLETFEVKAILVVPVLIPVENQADNRLWGLIVAHQCTAERDWQPDEVSLLETLSVHCAIAIQHAELLATTQSALEKEKSLNEFQSQIVATVSHEYNTPLTAIQAAAELLYTHEDELDAPTQKHFLEIIINKSKHLSTLVKNMLSVHRSGLDEIKVKLAEVDLETFMLGLLKEHQAVDTQHRLHLKTRGDLSGFVGDIDLMHQIFSNLLSNAVKYSPTERDIQIYLVGDEQQITCDIKDRGIGIAEKDREHLFQSFSRGSNVGAIAGTGLGLQIVKKAIELHEGTIDVISHEGKGTQVRVCLPKYLDTRLDVSK